MAKNSALLVKPLLSREDLLSSHVEGTQSGLSELYRYEADQHSSDSSEAPWVCVAHCAAARRPSIAGRRLPTPKPRES
ncbi:Fic/DOC family N-terminal domain-containing protein [Candidatus Cryosericum septentrionale]|uniref:Fic/DOC family N-terminal domain-containing protein n=1 Tax=Candidatus Cryosericum septentrionale TaxID=2290913 RepID=UPI0014035AFC